jgi:hypothetical protein
VGTVLSEKVVDDIYIHQIEIKLAKILDLILL